MCLNVPYFGRQNHSTVYKTAANLSCFLFRNEDEDASTVHVRCGEWDFTTFNKTENKKEVIDYQEIKVQRIVIHPSE